MKGVIRISLIDVGQQLRDILQGHINDNSQSYTITYYSIEGRSKMKKSFTHSYSSKKGSINSFLSLRDDCSLQLMKISLKTQSDRRDRLERLLSRYIEIQATQKQYMKTLKSNIIELKDIPTVSKLKFLVDPNIYVDNNLSVQTREFLCLLLNTFYKRYEENAEYEKKGNKLVENIKHLIKGITHNEELLFQIQKMNINQQVLTQGQILKQKNKLRQESNRTAGLQTEKNRIQAIWKNHKALYEQQKRKQDGYDEVIADIKHKINQMEEKLIEGEQIREGNRQKMSGQMVYHIKFDDEGRRLKQAIIFQQIREKALQKKILQKKLLIEQLKNNANKENIKHSIKLKLLQINPPIISQNICLVSELEMQSKSSSIKTSCNIAPAG